jgi:hypothetical protein
VTKQKVSQSFLPGSQCKLIGWLGTANNISIDSLAP